MAESDLVSNSSSSSDHGSDQMDDFEQLTLERNSCFAISYLLLKHSLLSVMFLMAIFTLVRLTMIDSHVKHVIEAESNQVTNRVKSDASNLATLAKVNSTIASTADQLVSNVTHEGNDLKSEFTRVKLTVFLARISAILAIVFGIMGIFTESVTLLLLFILHTSFRLITTLYVPAFHHGIISMVTLLIIDILSFSYVILLIIRTWNICLSKHKDNSPDKLDPLASKLESAIEVKITIPEDEDLTGGVKDRIMNALNRRNSKALSISTVSSFNVSKLRSNSSISSFSRNKLRSNSIISTNDSIDFQLRNFYLKPPNLNNNSSSSMKYLSGSNSLASTCRSSQCLPPSIADAIAKSLASTYPATNVIIDQLNHPRPSEISANDKSESKIQFKSNRI